MHKSFAITSLLAIACMASLPVAAQVQHPVKWAYTARPKGPGKYEVVAKATLEKGWHLYSQTTPDGGPIPTSFRFTKNPLVDLTGPVKEVGKLEKHHEKLFGVDVHQFSQEVSFVQAVTLKGKVKTNVSGTVEYMLCNDKECLPPTTKDFSVELK